MNHTMYLLTGAAGFLGSHICQELLSRGDEVRALVLRGDKAIRYVPAAAEIVEGDLCDKASLEAFFAVPEGTQAVVIHCASMVTVNPDFNQKLIDINVGGTKNIIDLCLEHPECQKLVYVSSTGAIPEQPKGTRIKETDQFTPIDEARQVGCYSQSKAMATQEVLDAVRERGLNACVVHPSGILGPNDHAVSETTGTIIKIMNGEMPVGMGGSFNLCDVRDLAHGCVAAADKGRRGECYILGNKEVTLKEVCKMLHDASGCKMPLFYVPIKMAYGLAAQMEKKAAKTGEKPLMTNFAVYNLARNNDFDYSKAERELGYHTRPYAETLRDEAQWLVAEGRIKGMTKLTPPTPAERTGVLSSEQAEGIRELLSAREVIRIVENAESADALARAAEAVGITGFAPEMAEECWKHIAITQDWGVMEDLLRDTDYDSVHEKLAARGIECGQERFELIRDTIDVAQDEHLLQRLAVADSTLTTLGILQDAGYKSVTAAFVELLRDNTTSLVRDGMLTEEDVRAFAGKDFFEREKNALPTLTAMCALISLYLRVDAMAPAFLIAIAGSVSLLQGQENNER